MTKLLILSGPSGVGKDTVLSILQSLRPNTFVKNITYTTRDPRPGEINGLSYNFISEEELFVMQENEQFLELTQVHGSYYYASSMVPILEIIASGKCCIFIIDVKGYSKIKKELTIPHLSAYLHLTDLSMLKDRINQRGIINEDELQKRLNNTLEEDMIGKSGIYNIVLSNISSENTAIQLLEKLYIYNSLSL